jgi:hypothetical protein
MARELEKVEALNGEREQTASRDGGAISVLVAERQLGPNAGELLR